MCLQNSDYARYTVLSARISSACCFSASPSRFSLLCHFGNQCLNISSGNTNLLTLHMNPFVISWKPFWVMTNIHTGDVTLHIF